MGSITVLGFRCAIDAFAAFDWFDTNQLGKKAKLVNQMLEDSDDLGWNAERFKAMTKDRIAAVERVFTEEDQVFATRHFHAGWTDIFPSERVPDTVTERQLEQIGADERAAVEAFTARAVEHAKTSYMSANL